MTCVLEVTQTHIHIHTHKFTPWRVPRGGGLEGRHMCAETVVEVASSVDRSNINITNLVLGWDGHKDRLAGRRRAIYDRRA